MVEMFGSPPEVGTSCLIPGELLEVYAYCNCNMNDSSKYVSSNCSQNITEVI